ncbi:uncharacterized protein Z518_06127 [Rhinocladiella mackenziei CBS 650.93]|uniref:Uncharacterized protein n=1 Tax=Rhinocladiella mackenziei CBS 650.93 TaxID=1442369 RepID=A0A0D2J860_9EURO|nr:uncharacterized protein Z518_06127 [Rhinocladiella mackenziei CBS 650.93]KIX05255.1 hypothetical protein Z518_06127 [Rhinocladiella mackenziei CBS 650.93]
MSRSEQIVKTAESKLFPGAVLVLTKFVYTGYSYRSFLTGALLAYYGDFSDGAIQTDFVLNLYSAFSFGWQYEARNDPIKFAGRGNGYIVIGTESSLQRGFFSNQGLLDPDMLKHGNEILQPATVGEFRSTFKVTGLPALKFVGLM